MIRHIVFFKFKPESTAEQRRAALGALRALPGKIDVIRSFEVGENILESARAWDAALIGTYQDLQALAVYTDHPEHVAVAVKLREISAQIGSVDYEY